MYNNKYYGKLQGSMTTKRYGIFDIIGPVMVGPSSSHTAGAARLGFLAGSLCKEEIVQADFFMHGSFARTYSGHGTDKALLAGIMGIPTADSRIKEAFSIADSRGIRYRFEPADLGDVHPNTVHMVLKTISGKEITLTGSSIGGGNIYIMEINGVSVNFSGEAPILATIHRDEPGVIAGITALLYNYRINIGNMQVSRREDVQEASMYMELIKPNSTELIKPNSTELIKPNSKLIKPNFTELIKSDSTELFPAEAQLPENLEQELMEIGGVRQVILLDQSKIASHEERHYV